MSKTRRMRFDRGFQHSVLRLMLMDHQFCHRCVELLLPSHFLDKLSWFFTNIRDFYNEHGQMPTKETIAADIDNHSVDKQQEYFDELREIFNVEPVPEKIKSLMTDFVRANIFVEAATKAANLYNNKHQSEAFDYIRERIEALHDANFFNDPYSRFGDVDEVLAKAVAETKGAIKTGIQVIDDEIKGLLPGTFTVFLGASNAGKSMLGPALAKQAAIDGKRTFVTIHEDEEIPTKIRYLACFADIEINKLTYNPGGLTEEEKKRLADADTLLKEYVVLRFMYTTDATVENVMNVARSLKRDWKPSPAYKDGNTWGFDLFICDYGQCLTSKTAGRVEVRHLHEHVYHMLKQLCLELKIAGAGGAQVNRSGMAMNRAGSDYLRCTDVSEAYGIIKKATNVITINRSNDDVLKNRIVFLLDKARNGKCPVAVECVSDFSKGVAYYTDKQQTPLDIAGGPAAMKDDEDSFGPKVSKKQYQQG